MERKPSLEEVTSDSLSLLEHPSAREVFVAFQKKTVCFENAYFCLQVQAYRSTPSAKGANEIFNTYIKTNSDLEINIDFKIRQQLLDHFAAADSTFEAELFDAAFSQIATMMDTDTLPKFRSSPEFKALEQDFQ
eukprot:TRINITY_DN1099_c0_g1_i5.p2 TRINITY_DN1099_c0_g1~~TRINITY_DN1099_c0_g1_i5.p2  ORF type:complete len:134 (+),score=40.18 TRINITY_DN1099_c0_g1_i5:250-651(+)